MLTLGPATILKRQTCEPTQRSKMSRTFLFFFELYSEGTNIVDINSYLDLKKKKLLSCLAVLPFFMEIVGFRRIGIYISNYIS